MRREHLNTKRKLRNINLNTYGRNLCNFIEVRTEIVYNRVREILTEQIYTDYD